MLRSGLAALATAAVAASVTLVAGATPAAAAAACTYVAEPLALPAGMTTATVDATDGNTTFAGRGVGSRDKIVLWRDGVPEALSMAASSLILRGINEAGDLVGSRSVSTGVGGPLWYHAGTLQRSSVFGDDSPRLTDINAAGDIVGFVRRNGVQKVALWRTGHQADLPVILPTPDGFFPVDPQVAPDGSVAIFGVIGTDSYGYVWAPDGTRQTLATPPGGTISGVTDIRGRRIIGSAWGVGAVEWDLSGALLATPGTPATQGVAVTSTGTVLMSYEKPGERTTVPVVVSPGGEWQYLPAPAGSTRARAGSITEAGVVGGDYLDAATGQWMPVRWKCVS